MLWSVIPVCFLGPRHTLLVIAYGDSSLGRRHHALCSDRLPYQVFSDHNTLSLQLFQPWSLPSHSVLWSVTPVSFLGPRHALLVIAYGDSSLGRRHHALCSDRLTHQVFSDHSTLSLQLFQPWSLPSHSVLWSVVPVSFLRLHHTYLVIADGDLSLGHRHHPSQLGQVSW